MPGPVQVFGVWVDNQQLHISTRDYFPTGLSEGGAGRLSATNISRTDPARPACACGLSSDGKLLMVLAGEKIFRQEPDP